MRPMPQVQLLKERCPSNVRSTHQDKHKGGGLTSKWDRPLLDSYGLHALLLDELAEPGAEHEVGPGGLERHVV